MLKKSAFILIALCISISVLCAQERLNTAKFDSLLSSIEKNNKGMFSLCLSKNGEELYSRSIGYATISDKDSVKASKDTKYRIGSVSKMFTAVMIFQLIEEKKLMLSTPLSNFFPQVPNATGITIGNLLNHHSGVYDFTRDSSFADWLSNPRTHEQMINTIISHPATFSPGERGDYSNSNYVLLGYIIEKITGNSYKKELKNRVLTKLGLKNTYYGGKPDPKRNEASSYEFIRGKWTNGLETDMSIPGGAGAIVSTPKDLSIFIDGLFNHKLVSDSSLVHMTTITDTYGMGIFKMPFYQKTAFGHNGRIDNFTTVIEYYPEDSMVLGMTCNGQNYPMNTILIGLLNIYYNRPYVIPSFEGSKVSREKLAMYEGVYSSKTLPLKITIKIDDDILTARATGQSAFPLDAESDSKFKFDDAGIQIEFHTSPENKVDHLTIVQGGQSNMFEKE